MDNYKTIPPYAFDDSYETIDDVRNENVADLSDTDDSCYSIQYTRMNDVDISYNDSDSEVFDNSLNNNDICSCVII